MAILSPLSVSASGYLTTGQVRSLAVVSDGYLANVVVVEPPGDGPIKGGVGGAGRYYRTGTASIYQAEQLRRLKIEDDDMLTLFMIATMYGLLEGDEDV